MPPLEGFAVKVTFVPAQILSEEAEILKLGDAVGLTEMFKLFEFAVFNTEQIFEVVMKHVTISP